MQNGNALRAQIQRLFFERLAITVPAPDTDLFETGALDSLSFVQLLAALEETFGLHVSVEDLAIDDFRTVSRIAHFVAGKQLSPQ